MNSDVHYLLAQHIQVCRVNISQHHACQRHSKRSNRTI